MKTIDQTIWPRAASFKFFSSCRQPHFEVTAKVDITQTYLFLKKHGISPFAAIMWCICHAANDVTEFRYRIRGEQVVEHESIHPSFTSLNDDKSLTFCLARYTPDILQFISNVEKSQQEVEQNAEAADAQAGDDALYISCLPWVDFTSISHPVKADDSASIPRITWGKFSQEGNQWSMPVALMLHHGLADGYHVSLFFEKLQKLLHDPELHLGPVKDRTLISPGNRRKT